MVTRRTFRFKAMISGAEARERLRLERKERARRDACPSHFFIRVEGEPPSWFCPSCNSEAGLDYVRGFVSGLIAAHVDPARFIADYGTWP